MSKIKCFWLTIFLLIFATNFKSRKANLKQLLRGYPIEHTLLKRGLSIKSYHEPKYWESHTLFPKLKKRFFFFFFLILSLSIFKTVQMYQVGKQSSAWPLYSPHEESIQLQWKVQSKERHYSFRYFCCFHMKSHEGHEKSQEIRDSREGWNRLKIFGKKTLEKIFHGPSVAEAKLFQLSSSDYYYYYYFYSEH